MESMPFCSGKCSRDLIGQYFKSSCDRSLVLVARFFVFCFGSGGYAIVYNVMPLFHDLMTTMHGVKEVIRQIKEGMRRLL